MSHVVKRVVRQDGDGLGDKYSDAGALYCDPELVVIELEYDELGRSYPVERYPGKSMARQSEADSADINIILERMRREGVVPLTSAGLPRFLDVSEVPDFRGALEQVRKARGYFDALPADSRAIFGNDVAEFLDAVVDLNDGRLEDLIKAGVVKEDEVIRSVVPSVDGGAGAPGKAAP